jgi:hypothetical protein
MFGQATPGATRVPVQVRAETAVKSDAWGQYKLDIDTSGVPGGTYMIEGQGQSKTVQLGSSAGQFIPSTEEETVDVDETADSKPAKLRMTSEVIQWYARQQNLDPCNSTQYAEAESGLKKMTGMDQWRVIARGDPLTEKAGDCQEDYCLVRWAGTCKVCRDKEMVAYAKRAAHENAQKINNDSAEAGADQSTLASTPEKEEGFIGEVIDWMRKQFG